MLKRILSVGAWTLLSRITGFARDIVLAAVLGAGALMDVFSVANRLPNHFRAIFAEGAFNSAFVPAYTRILTQEGEAPARLFSGRIMVMLALAVSLLTAFAMWRMDLVIAWLAPGFADEPTRGSLAVVLTRITFPYLVFVSLVTLLSGVLNAHGRFAAAAAAPVLLNVAIVAAVAAAFLFPSAAHAAAWGVFAAGLLELLLVWVAAARAQALPQLAAPRLDAPTRGFFKALLPATIGAAGTQIAMFADTILVTYLAAGGASTLYYADRLYQLPVGVVGIAAGTVLLPEMSRLLAQGDEAGAIRAQNRSAAFTLMLSAPFLVAFLVLPVMVMEALFVRGAFDQAAAQAAGAVLAAYAVGLPAVVLIRSAVAPFFARGDTRTPVIASMSAVGINILLKLWLMPLYGAPGLALATALGAWINLAILTGIALHRGWTRPDGTLGRVALAVAGASLALMAVLAGLPRLLPLPALDLPGGLHLSAAFTTLALAASLGGLVYVGLLLACARVMRVPLRRV